MFKCEYCKKSFKRENTLAIHMCEQKRRNLQKDEKHVVAGYRSYTLWYKMAMGSKKEKTYDEFAKSQYYSAFVNFGLYVLEIRATDPEKYLKWLVVQKVRLSDWTKDSIYNKYLADHQKKETPERAVERFVIHANAWAESKGYHWSEYWDKAGTNAIVQHIMLGKISPWVLFGSNKAQNFVDTLPGEIVLQIADTIDIDYWKRKMKVFPDDIQWINEVIG